MNEKGNITGILLVALAGICWGSIGLFIRTFNAAGLYSMDMVVLRSVFTCIAMFFFLLFYDRKLLKIRLKDIWCFLGTGIVSMVFFNFCYFSLISLSSLSVAAVMLYTAPVFVMLLSAPLFGERITGKKVLSLILTVLGCVFVTGVLGDAASLGAGAVLFGLGAGLGYALYSIFSRFALQRGYHSFTISFYTFLFASLAALPLSDGGRIMSVSLSGPFMLFFSAACGIVTTALPYIVYNYGLSSMENSQAAIIASIEPVVATLFGFFVFHEVLTPGNMLGIALVLSAIVLSNL